MTDQWAYRLPFAVPWVSPVPLLILIFLSPEAPWWLVRHGILHEAEGSVQRLASAEMKGRARDIVAMVSLRAPTKRNSLCPDCPNQSARGRLTSIAFAVPISAEPKSPPSLGHANCFALSHLPVGPHTSSSKPASPRTPTTLGLGNTAGAFCGTVGSWFLITHFGGRTLFLAGVSWLRFGLLLIGILAVTASKGHEGAKCQAGMVFVWVFSYDLTIGPLAYCIVGAASSTRLRNKTVGLSRNASNILGVIAGEFSVSVSDLTD